MGYIEDNLSKDEVVMAKIKHSWAGLVSVIIYFLLNGVITALCFAVKPVMATFGVNLDSDAYYKVYVIIFYIMGALFLIKDTIYVVTQIIEMKSAELVVTNKRIFGRRGFISRHTTDILLSKIDTINISNGLFGAILGYGRVEIVSAASGRMTRAERATLRYSFVSNASEFRKAVLETIDKVKKEEQEAQARSLSEAMKNQ